MSSRTAPASRSLLRLLLASSAAATVFLPGRARAYSVDWTIPASTPSGSSFASFTYSDGRLYAGGTQNGLNPAVAAYTTDGSLLWSRVLTNPLWGGPGVSPGGAGGGFWAIGQTNAPINGQTGAEVGAGGNDAFVIRFTADGTQQTTTRLGGTGDDFVSGSAGDAAGNAYTAGHAFGSLVSPPQPGYAPDGFVAKHDAYGALQWVRSAGTPQLDVGRAVAADPGGNVLFAGETEGVLASAKVGTRDAFLQKYDAAGTLLWQRQFGTGTYDSVAAVYTDPAGNAYVGGSWQSGYWIAKYAPDGRQEWFAKRTSPVRLYDLIVGPAGRIFFSGITPGDTASGDYYDIFVSEVSASQGAPLWSLSYDLRTTGQDLVGSMTADDTALYIGSVNAGGFLSKVTVVAPEPTIGVTLAGLLATGAVVSRPRRRTVSTARA